MNKQIQIEKEGFENLMSKHAHELFPRLKIYYLRHSSYGFWREDIKQYQTYEWTTVFFQPIRWEE